MIRRALRWRDRRRRTPTRLQFQTTECGVAILAMMLAHFGRPVSMEAVRQATGVSRDCVNARDIMRAGEALGLTVRALRREPEQLEALGFPLVVHLRFIHFTVLEGMTPSHALLNDPSCGRIEIPREIFHEDFTGVVLAFAPAPTAGAPLTPLPARRHPLLPDAARPPVALAVAAVGAYVLSVCAATALLGDWTARAAAGAAAAPDAEAVAGLVLAAALAGAFRWTQIGLLATAAHRAAVDGTRALLAHVMALPQAFFTYRLPWRLVDTVSACETTARLFHEELLAPLVGLGGAAVLAAAIWRIDPTTAAGLAVPVAGYLIALAALFRWRDGDNRAHRRTAEDAMEALAHAVEKIDKNKLAGRDEEFFAGAMGINAGQQRHRQAYGVAARLVLIAPRLLELAVLSAAALLGGTAVAAGRLDVGDAVAQSLLALALCRLLAGLAGTHGKWDLLRHQTPHIDDVLSHPTATPVEASAPGDKSGAAGTLRLDDVSFGYAALRPPLLTGLSLEVRPGEQLGITGLSGGGKSTLAGLLSGLHRPWSGTATFDGLPVDVLARRVRPGLIAWVGKQTFFFDGTVRENLCLWDAPDEGTLAQAISDACLDELLASRPDGIETRLAPYGRNFSGGERQRLEIARALIRAPAVLVLDEATDALDPALEARLRANLRRRGCAVILIGHRRSTLEACDRVLHVAGGTIAAGAGAGAGADAGDAVAQTAVPTSTPSAVAEPVPHDTDALITAFRHATKALGRDIAPRVPEALSAGPEGLRQLARQNRLRFRMVRFRVAAWWRAAQGPLIAFARQDGTPVAIVGGGSAPVVVDPRAQSSAPLDAARAAALADEAYQLYPEPVLTASGPWTWLGRALRNARPDLARAVGISVALAALSVLFPLAAARLIADAAGTTPKWMMAAGLVAALVAVGLLECARAIALLRAEGRCETAMLSALLQRILRIDPAVLRRMPPEDLIYSLTGIGRFLEILQGLPVQRALDGGLAVAGLALLGAFDLRLLAPVLPIVAAMLVFPVISTRTLRRYEPLHARERRYTRRFLHGVIGNLARLRLLGRAEAAAQHWRERDDLEQRFERRLRRADAARIAWAEACLWLGPGALLLWITAVAPIAPWLIPAAVLAAWLSLSGTAGLGDALAAALRARLPLAHLGLLSDAPLEAQGDCNARTADTIEVRDVVYAFPGTTAPVLDGVSLAVAPGELIVLAGPSGSGKSTLLQLIMGFARPQRGDIRVGGLPLEALDLELWRRTVGAVFQTDHLEPASTVRGQLAGQSAVGLDEVWRAAEIALLADDIRRLPMGMQNIVDDGMFSTGQIQRLLIASELVRRPRLLILDEATNAIPDAVQNRVIANLRALGLTCLLATHRETAIAAADRVVVLERGRVAFNGPPDRFLAETRLRRLLRDEASA